MTGGASVTANEPILIRYYWLKSILFTWRPCPVSVPGPHPRSHVTFTCHVSLGSSRLWPFLSSFLFLMSLKSVGQVFFRMFCKDDCALFIMWLIPSQLMSTTWLRWSFFMFLHGRLLFSFQAAHFGRKSLCAAHTSKCEFCSTSLSGGIYVN